MARIHQASTVKTGTLVSCYGVENDFYIEHKPGVKHVIPDTLSRYPMDAFSVDIPECPPPLMLLLLSLQQLLLTFHITLQILSALFSSSLQCLYLASNHIDTVKLTVSSISSLANMPTRPHICKKVCAHSDSVPPTVTKEDIPFPASAALRIVTAT